MSYDNLPDFPAIAQLKSLPHWVAWKYVIDPNQEKPKKIPINPSDGKYGAVNRPKTWSSYNEAVARAKKDKLPGVGYVLTDGDGITGADLDNVRDATTGKLEPWAAEIVALSETYCEISPSGTGLRFFWDGKIDQVIKKDKHSVEVYATGRYLTVTGDHIEGTPTEILPAPLTEKALRRRVGKSDKDFDLESDDELPDHIRGAVSGGRGVIDPRSEGSKYSKLNAEALSDLDKWVPALFGRGIIKTDDGRYRIPSKVLKRKLQEDISISPIGSQNPGIIDFGVADMGDKREGKRTAIELVEEHSKTCKGMEASSERYELAYKTLAIRLGHREEEIAEKAVLEIELKAGEVSRIVDETQRAIVAAGRPIFVRGGVLVEPIWTKYPTIGEDTTTVTVFRAVTIENLRYIVNKWGIKYLQWNDKKKKNVEVDPPDKVLATLVKLGHWSFPRVAGIINSPTLRPDGSVLSDKGYDAKTQLWCWPDDNLKLPEMPAKPTKKDAQVALELLKGLLDGFAFQDDKLDMSVALAAILTTILRGAFDIAPMTLFMAHMAGTGKSYLVDLVSTIARGRPCPVITASRDEVEMEKRIGSLLIESAPMISIDNLSFDLKGDLLCQMCTQQTVKVRVLGKSETPDCEWKGSLFATGNNVNLSGDMTRRGLICNLDANVERPELREFDFSPIDMVLKDRGKYIAAVLTIARAYVVGGKLERVEKIGSYGQWSKFVREPLMWLGEADPTKSMEQAFANDPAKEAAERLIEQWKEVLGTEEAFKVNEIIDKAKENDPNPTFGTGVSEFLRKYPDFFEVLLERAGDRGQIDPRKMAYWLRALNGQIYNGFKVIMVSGPAGKGHKWKVAAK